MTYRRTACILFVALALVACNRTAQAPGMDAKDLSDDRGARAGRFLAPTDHSASVNATDPGDDSTTVESNQ